jgi:hypothetical protein
MVQAPIWEFCPIRDTFIGASQNDFFERPWPSSEILNEWCAMLRISYVLDSAALRLRQSIPMTFGFRRRGEVRPSESVWPGSPICSEQRTNTCGQRHGKRAPECDAHCTQHYSCAARACGQPAQKGEEHQ